MDGLLAAVQNGLLLLKAASRGAKCHSYEGLLPTAALSTWRMDHCKLTCFPTVIKVMKGQNSSISSLFHQTPSPNVCQHFCLMDTGHKQVADWQQGLSLPARGASAELTKQ